MKLKNKLWSKKLIKNKVWATILICLGILSVIAIKDATFLVFSLIFGIPVFFSKTNCIL